MINNKKLESDFANYFVNYIACDRRCYIDAYMAFPIIRDIVKKDKERSEVYRYKFMNIKRFFKLLDIEKLCDENGILFYDNGIFRNVKFSDESYKTLYNINKDIFEKSILTTLKLEGFKLFRRSMKKIAKRCYVNYLLEENNPDRIRLNDCRFTFEEFLYVFKKKFPLLTTDNIYYRSLKYNLLEYFN